MLVANPYPNTRCPRPCFIAILDRALAACPAAPLPAPWAHSQGFRHTEAEGEYDIIQAVVSVQWLPTREPCPDSTDHVATLGATLPPCTYFT